MAVAGATESADADKSTAANRAQEHYQALYNDLQRLPADVQSCFCDAIHRMSEAYRR